MAGDRIQQVLIQYRADIDDLKKDVKEANKEIEEVSKTAKKEGGKMSATFKKVGGAILAAFAAAEIGQAITDMSRLAAEAEGVRNAFNATFTSADLERFRRATKGTVSDLELMKRVLKAKEFNIPADTLAKGLEFARVQANKLGEDVGFMSQSIVDGLGRKSALVLDNLGIAQSELSAEVKETGDFYTAVANIIDRKLGADATADVETLADQQARLNANVANLRLEIATALTPAFANLTTKALDFIRTLNASVTAGGLLSLSDVVTIQAGAQDAVAHTVERLRTQVASGLITSGQAVEFLAERVESLNTQAQVLRADGGFFDNKTARRAFTLSSQADELALAIGGFEERQADANVVMDDGKKAADETNAAMDRLIQTIIEGIDPLKLFNVEATRVRDTLVEISEPDVEDDIDTAAYLDALQEVTNIREAIQKESLASLGSLTSSIAGTLEEGTKGAEALLAISKGAAIAQVLINLEEEISGIYSNKFLTAFPDLGTGAKTAAAVVAGIRAAASIATISAQGFAKGTSDAPEGLSWVGEEGPELMQMPKGAAVYTAKASVDYRNAIEAINAGQLDKFVFDNYLGPGLGAMAAAMRGEDYTGDFSRLINATRSNRVIELGPKTRRLMRHQRRKPWH